MIKKMDCRDCGAKMVKFKAKIARYQYEQVNDLWICLDCGYEREITRKGEK